MNRLLKTEKFSSSSWVDGFFKNRNTVELSGTVISGHPVYSGRLSKFRKFFPLIAVIFTSIKQPWSPFTESQQPVVSCHGQLTRNRSNKTRIHVKFSPHLSLDLILVVLVNKFLYIEWLIFSINWRFLSFLYNTLFCGICFKTFQDRYRFDCTIFAGRKKSHSRELFVPWSFCIMCHADLLQKFGSFQRRESPSSRKIWQWRSCDCWSEGGEIRGG